MRRLLAPLLPAIIFLAGCPGSSPTSGTKSKTPEPKSAPASAPASVPANQHSEKGTTPETRDNADADGVVRRGVVVASEEAMTVSALLASADDLNGTVVTLTGTVDQVCAKKGCWMALVGEPGQPPIRITSKGYKYFVPRAAKGMNATVKGELAVRELDQATAKHYAEESGEAVPEDLATKELAIASVGLELWKDGPSTPSGH